MSRGRELRIVPTGEEHVPGLHRCIDAIARERLYLGLLEAKPLDAAYARLRGLRETNGVHLVALDAADNVVGWCDVHRHPNEGFRHGGTLGIGVLASARVRGLGRRLMEAALDEARRQGFERIDLEVFASNPRAIALYASLGFVREGLKRRVRKIDGRYDDDVVMALLFDALPGPAGG